MSLVVEGWSGGGVIGSEWRWSGSGWPLGCRRAGVSCP